MRGLRYWVHQGDIEPVLPGRTLLRDDEDRLLKSGSVRLTTGELGTEVKWTVQSPCIYSLLQTLQWLPAARSPYVLRFFAVGWFEEVYRDASSAVTRIEQVLARGDRHFTSRVFIREAAPDSLLMPQAVKDALAGEGSTREFAVDCVFDEISKAFKVERIGPRSAIGQVWGTFTSSHPCQSEGSYGDPVNATYEDVLKSNRPRYDHVLAALRLPDNALHWVPYHRVVLPRLSNNGPPRVTVVSQIARVDIRVL
jgi:hypothetical protein